MIKDNQKVFNRLMVLIDVGITTASFVLAYTFKFYVLNDGPGIGPTCSVRNGDWKLIYYYETGKKELFNITEDIGEHNDVARQHPDIVKRLSGELGTYLRKVDGQRPSFKATGKPVPWPDEIY